MVLSVAAPEKSANDVLPETLHTTPPPPKNMFFYELDLRHNRILHISNSTKDVLGYSSSEIIHNGLKWFVEQIHPDDLENLNHLADRQLHSSIVPLVYYRFKHKSGYFCRLYENRCLLHDVHGSPTFLIGKIEQAQ